MADPLMSFLTTMYRQQQADRLAALRADQANRRNSRQQIINTRRADAKAASAARLKELRDTQAATRKARTQQIATNRSTQAARNNAIANARANAIAYLQERGLDPSVYQMPIENAITSAISTASKTDPDIGQYLVGLGEDVYTGQTAAERTKATSAANQLFAPEFERSRIADTVDDDILARIDAAERGEALSYVDNLFKRGVITDAGRQGSLTNINDQGARVKAILDEIGSTALAGGRQKLTDISNRANQTAANLQLGQTFDPNVYQSQADQATNQFLSGLESNIRSKLSDNLYDTSGLAAFAGQTSGAQNTKFDPLALSGVIDPNAPLDKEEEERKRRRITF